MTGCWLFQRHIVAAVVTCLSAATLSTLFSFTGELNSPASSAKIRPVEASVLTNDTSQAQLPARPKMLIMGAAKNAEQHLPLLEQNFRRILANDSFEVVRMVFYENDSTDRTADMLKSWEKNLSPVTVISEVNLTAPNGLRTEYLAHARNVLWKHATEEVKEPFDYVLVVDMDDVNYHLAHLNECLNLPKNWTVCCVNQYSVYYDLWALRTKDDWVNHDWWNGGLNKPKSLREVAMANRHIPASADPIDVNSCFGGAAIYAHWKIKHLRFDTHVGSAPYKGPKRNRRGEIVALCEHATFHDSLRRQYPNMSLYIQPKFLNNGPGPNRFALAAPSIRHAVLRKWRHRWKKSWRDPAMAKYYETLGQSERDD